MRIQEGKAALFLVNFAVKYFPKDMHSNKLNGIVYFSFAFTAISFLINHTVNFPLKLDFLMKNETIKKVVGS